MSAYSQITPEERQAHIAACHDIVLWQGIRGSLIWGGTFTVANLAAHQFHPGWRRTNWRAKLILTTMFFVCGFWAVGESAGLECTRNPLPFVEDYRRRHREASAAALQTSSDAPAAK